MKGRSVLVTGGTGFIGANLIAALAERGAKVAAICRDPERAVRLKLAGVLDRVQLLRADLLDYGSLESALQAGRPEVVVHLAAYGVRVEASDAENAVAVNVLGSTHLMRACVKTGVRRLVWMGSGFEYAMGQPQPLAEKAVIEPATWYGATKQAAWHLAQFLQRTGRLEVVTLRLFSAYGPMEHPSRLIPYIITRGLRGLPVDLTSGEQQRDYLYAADVCSALALLSEKTGIQGESFNLGYGQPAAVRDIAQTIARLLARPVNLQIGARSRKRPEPDAMIADTAKLQSLGWTRAFDFESGLRRTIEWYDRHAAHWDEIP